MPTLLQGWLVLLNCFSFYTSYRAALLDLIYKIATTARVFGYFFVEPAVEHAAIRLGHLKNRAHPSYMLWPGERMLYTAVFCLQGNLAGTQEKSNQSTALLKRLDV